MKDCLEFNIYGTSSHVWEVFPYMGNLPTYGKTSHIWEVFLYIGSLPTHVYIYMYIYIWTSLFNHVVMPIRWEETMLAHSSNSAPSTGQMLRMLNL